jgi:hypothetical protein
MTNCDLEATKAEASVLVSMRTMTDWGGLIDL